MRVPEDDDIRLLFIHAALEGFGQVASLYDVVNEELLPGELNGFSFLEADSGICVAQHSRHRRDSLQLRDQPRESDVAAVQDMIDALKQLGQAGVKVVVRV